MTLNVTAAQAVILNSAGTPPSSKSLAVVTKTSKSLKRKFLTHALGDFADVGNFLEIF